MGVDSRIIKRMLAALNDPQVIELGSELEAKAMRQRFYRASYQLKEEDPKTYEKVSNLSYKVAGSTFIAEPGNSLLDAL